MVPMVYPTEATVMYANNNQHFQGNFQGHNQGFHGGKKGNSKKDRPTCTYCGLVGHIADKCYKLHGYSLRYKPKGSNKPLANQVSTILPTGIGNFGGVDGFGGSQFFQASGGFPTIGG